MRDAYDRLRRSSVQNSASSSAEEAGRRRQGMRCVSAESESSWSSICGGQCLRIAFASVGRHRPCLAGAVAGLFHHGCENGSVDRGIPHQEHAGDFREPSRWWCRSTRKCQCCVSARRVKLQDNDRAVIAGRAAQPGKALMQTGFVVPGWPRSMLCWSSPHELTGSGRYIQRPYSGCSSSSTTPLPAIPPGRTRPGSFARSTVVPSKAAAALLPTWRSLRRRERRAGGPSRPTAAGIMRSPIASRTRSAIGPADPPGGSPMASAWHGRLGRSQFAHRSLKKCSTPPCRRRRISICFDACQQHVLLRRRGWRQSAGRGRPGMPWPVSNGPMLYCGDAGLSRGATRSAQQQGGRGQALPRWCREKRRSRSGQGTGVLCGYP